MEKEDFKANYNEELIKETLFAMIKVDAERVQFGKLLIEIGVVDKKLVNVSIETKSNTILKFSQLVEKQN